MTRFEIVVSRECVVLAKYQDRGVLCGIGARGALYKECMTQAWKGRQLTLLCLTRTTPQKECRRKTKEVILDYEGVFPKDREALYILEQPFLRVSYPNLRARAGRNCR